MGSLSQSVASSMKMLIVLALAALAAAEPEADPYYYGYGVGYGHLGYGLGYYGYGKRSADAEPFYPYAPVAIHGYAPAAIPAVGGLYAGAGRYVVNSAGVVHVAKRSADAGLTPTTMVATAMAWAMAMAMVSMVATTGASMARGVLMLRPTPTTATVAMVAMEAMEATMEAMVATTGANKDLAKHQDGILSLFRTGQL